MRRPTPQQAWEWAKHLVDVGNVVGLGSKVVAFVLALFAPAWLPQSGLLRDASAAELPLAARIFLLIVAAMVLGWGLGFAISWLTRRNTTGRKYLALFVTIAWALLLVMVAEALSPEGSTGLVPELTLFLVAGLGIVMWLLAFSFRAEEMMGNVAVIEDRSLTIAVFAMTVVISGAVVRLEAMA